MMFPTRTIASAPGWGTTGAVLLPAVHRSGDAT